MAKQLYIPEFFGEVYSGGNNIPWDAAARYFRNSDHFGQRYADGSGMLENLIGFEKFYDERLNEVEFEDDFFDEWKWEICAFNVLCEGFSKLFAPAEAA